VWSDIVRDSMERGIPGTYLQLIRTAWTYTGSGALFRLMRLRKGPVIAALYPVGFLLVQLGIALLIAWGLGRALALIHPLAGWAGLIVVPFVLEWFRRKDNKFFAYYLMHDYAYSAQSRGANPPELEARMAEFTDEIAQALQTDVEEVLVVGHSSGAHLGVSILADLIRQGRLPQDGPVLSFLSLGQVVPMVSFLPEAHRLRADLHFLSARNDLTWVDVTAPGDGCAFALCDPVSVSGVAPADKRWPLVISAAFTQTLSPARWKELRWRFFRLHFQYLCAFDRPGDYDYFQITAGPVTLAERYADRAPSPSRIEIAASKYTGMAA
ncbi:MAG: alpha/beta hydrolase, partial [Rhodobacteraceae bacterium]|nr:alpha/beta hydrolase [Paracoccaceae bacterium]